MKTLTTIIKLLTVIGVLYGLSLFITKEMVTMAILIIGFVLIKMLIRIAISVLFTIVKWLCIVAIIGFLITTL